MISPARLYADFDKVVATNLRGTFLCSRAAVNAMKRQGTGGAIVNNSSCCGLAAWKNLAAYGASKVRRVGQR
jgi:NAD(P)-dependent dehydrogenase (short-subunit alcohol dehydrogenase family)